METPISQNKYFSLYFEIIVQFISVYLYSQNVDDDELFNLILKCHLLPNTVPTAIFPKLVEFVLMNQQADASLPTPYHLEIETVVNQLQEAGYQCEAGTMLMQHRSTHRSLRTFDAAFSVLTRLFKR